MKRYKFRKRFFVITATAGLLITGFSLIHIDETCSPKAAENVVKTDSMVYAQEAKEVYAGKYTITYYCDCAQCCGKTDGITATGTQATAGRTIAVDPDVIPLGTTVIINDHKYIAEDVGGAIKENRIDIFVDSHEEALELGVDYANVYLEGGYDFK